ncbi:MAG TPA: hypothetical protein VJU86_05945 [Pyrinomonadaceae bacterium]|nr:hypothetical protein [Pyrinomonadaceae bacterium]
MKPSRFLAYLVATVAFGLSILAYLEFIHLLGFPDGFITELSYAERMLARIFIGISVVLASYCIYLGVLATKKKIAKKLSGAMILYLVFMIGIALLDYYFRQHLMDSAGG